AAWKAIVRLLGKSPGNRGPVARRQGIEVRHRAQVLGHELPRVGARERQLAGQQLLVDDAQIVLIAEATDDAVKRLRRGIQRRDAAGHPRLHPFQALDQAEVPDLDMVIQEEEVLWLDVEVLELILRVHQVQGLGGLLHITEELLAGNAGQAVVLAFLIAVEEAAIGQIHDDEKLTVHDVVAFEGKDIRMTNALDAFESFEFLPDANLLFLAAAAVEAAVDDFDRLHDAAGSAGPPDFTKAALAKAVQKLVAGDRLCRAFHSNHVRPRSTCKTRRATRSV